MTSSLCSAILASSETEGDTASSELVASALAIAHIPEFRRALTRVAQMESLEIKQLEERLNTPLLLLESTSNEEQADGSGDVQMEDV